MPYYINALSIDLEEWYHGELFRKHAVFSKKSLIQESTEILLTLLEKYKVKATFFVVGEVAAQNTALIKKIHNTGHEIACHGFSHIPLYQLDPIAFKNELAIFKKTVTDILGPIEIKGFRAPSFSLSQQTSWAIDILNEFKFKYDSSIFPVKNNPVYGVAEAPLDIYGLSSKDIKTPDPNSTLKEFPITLFEIWKIRFPASGGFYLRLIPNYLQLKALRLINMRRPFILYIHPWECYPANLKIKLGIISNFICYYNIKSALAKLENIFKNFKFDRIDHILGL